MFLSYFSKTFYLFINYLLIKGKHNTRKIIIEVNTFLHDIVSIEMVFSGIGVISPQVFFRQKKKLYQQLDLERKFHKHVQAIVYLCYISKSLIVQVFIF